MPRYIDADLLKKNCKIDGDFNNFFTCVSLDTLGKVIDKQPDTAVEQIVRCKDCKGWNDDEWQKENCPWNDEFVMTDNCFCSNGVRKEEK